jgi:hypothetical protein
MGGEVLPLLVMGARSLGFELTSRQVENFQRYYEMLVDWNSRINLTAITDYEGVQVRHFLDSLTVGAAYSKEDIAVQGLTFDRSRHGSRLPWVALEDSVAGIAGHARRLDR